LCSSIHSAELVNVLGKHAAVVFRFDVLSNHRFGHPHRMVGHKGAELGAGRFHRTFDFAFGKLLDLFGIRGGSLPDALCLALGLDFGLRLNINQLLIQPGQSRGNLGQSLLGFFFLSPGLFQVSVYRGSAFFENLTDLDLVDEKIC
jgi:hypothetical protein